MMADNVTDALSTDALGTTIYSSLALECDKNSPVSHGQKLPDPHNIPY